MGRGCPVTSTSCTVRCSVLLLVYFFLPSSCICLLQQDSACELALPGSPRCRSASLCSCLSFAASVAILAQLCFFCIARDSSHETQSSSSSSTAKLPRRFDESFCLVFR